MAKKFEIIGQSLVVTDTDSGIILFDAPKSEYYYNVRTLYKGFIEIYNMDFGDNTQTRLDKISLSDAINASDSAFTEATFQTFARENLGFKQGGGSGSGAVVEDTPFDSSWNGNSNAATKNSIYDYVNGITAGAGDLTKLDNIAALRAVSTSPSNGDLYNLNGYYTNNDGGGGLFYWDSISTDSDDGGSVIKPTSITTGRFKRVIYFNSVSIEEFGALADNGATDSTMAYVNAVDFILGQGGGTVYIPSRGNNRFYITQNENVHLRNYSNLHVTGGGKVFVSNQNIPIGVTQGRGVFAKVADGTDNFKISNIDILTHEGCLANNFIHGVICQEEGGSWSRLTFDGLKIHSQDRPDTQVGNHGITFHRNTMDISDDAKCFDLKIRDCDIKLTGEAIYGLHFLRDIENITIDSCRVELTANSNLSAESYNPIALYGDCRNFSVVNCVVYSGGHSGIAASMAENGVIAFNKVYGVNITNEAGIEVEYKEGHGTYLSDPDFQTKAVKVHNNYVEDCYWGVAVLTREAFNALPTHVPPYDVQITNNSIKNSTSAGVVVASNASGTPDYTGGRIRGVLIDGNHIEADAGIGSFGVKLYDCDGAKVLNNTIIGHTRPLSIGRNSTIIPIGTFDVKGNTFIASTSTVATLIQIESVSSGVRLLINDNYFDGKLVTNVRGLQLSNVTNTNVILMASNNLFENCLDGLLVNNSSGVRGSISNNTAKGCTDKGFEIAIVDGLCPNNLSIDCGATSVFNGSGMDSTGSKNITT